MARIIISILLIFISFQSHSQIAMFNAHNFTGARKILLDEYSGADVALSFYKIRTSYGGNCIEVRRSSDNTTQNIGFLNGFVDTATLKSFIGSSDAFIRTWYDQSTNARDAQQTTNANQPQIASGGNLTYSNGNLAAYFGTGSNHWFLLLPSGYLHNATTLSYFHVINQIFYSGQNGGIFSPNNNFGVGLEVLQVVLSASDNITRIRTNNTARDPNSIFSIDRFWTGGQNSLTSIYGNSTEMAAYKNNGGQIMSNTTAMPSLNYNGQYALGTYAKNFGTTFNMNGYFLELVIYPTFLQADHSDIISIINSYYSIY